MIGNGNYFYYGSAFFMTEAEKKKHQETEREAVIKMAKRSNEHEYKVDSKDWL